MGLLSKIGLIGENAKTAEIFESLFGNKTFFDIEYDKPSDYVNIYWSEFKKHNYPSLNGEMFEVILRTLFVREDLLPMYIQAKVAFVPNVNYDSLFYSKECGPISISMKTSLRERYKQADLEAIALKYVHRKAKCFLLTLEEKEALSVKNKIKTGEVIGLDRVILCSKPEFDDLIEEIRQLSLTEAGTIEIIKCNQIITEHSISTINQ